MTPVAIQRVGFWALVVFGCFVAAAALMWSVMRWTVLAGLVFATLAVVVRRRLRSLGLAAGAMAVLALSASIGAGHAVSHFEPFKQEFRDTYLLPQIAFGAGFVVAAVVIHRRLDVVEDQAILDVAIGAVAFLVAAAVAFFLALYFVIGPPIVP